MQLDLLRRVEDGCSPAVRALGSRCRRMPSMTLVSIDPALAEAARELRKAGRERSRIA